MPKRNKTRPYSDDILLQLKEQHETIKDSLHNLKVTQNLISLAIRDIQTQLEVLGNLDWLKQELENQGHLTKKAT
jgi:hypothetical protein